MSITEVFANPRVRQKLPGAINAGMLLLLTASLAQWTWFVVKPPLPPLVIAPPPPPVPLNTFSLQPLLAAHLFGQVSQELTGGRLGNLPISSLNLVLTGVIASDTGGYALISVNSQPQEPFAVGQTITGGAVLQAVYPDRVIIRRNGVLESLLLAGADNSQPPLMAVAPRNNRPATVVGAPGEIVRETGMNQYTVAREQLAAQMRTPEFLRQATLMPASGGGFQVRQLQAGSLYERLGLRPGDVIKSINGEPINNAEDAMRLYQQMSTVSAVQLDIQRGNKSETIYYQFGQN
jgi:general secretion pathway protein C